MDIAFCYESVLPARGGCETYIADLARRLLADRHAVLIYACRWDEQALPRGIEFHPIPAALCEAVAVRAALLAGNVRSASRCDHGLRQDVGP
jgi:hypothetical protein